MLLASASGVYAQSLSVTLTPSTYNGYHISCFGSKDGHIDATVTGGTPPYSFMWSNGATTEDLSLASSGFYELKVIDADSTIVVASKTLVEPLALKITSQVPKYPNGHNISCNECFNGSIDITVDGGVAPYSYAWDDGVTTADRSGLGATSYTLVVTDANGCIPADEKFSMTQPDRMDWTMQGNADTDPVNHFFGTTDAKDVVFKSNGAERLRLGSSGAIKLLGDFAGEGPLFRNADGTLSSGEWPDLPELDPEHCRSLPSFPYWETRGNAFPDLCEDQIPILGTLNMRPLKLYTSGVERVHITPGGKVGIGTVPPAGAVEQYRLYVADGIATRDVLVKLGDWPDYVFKEGYHLMPLDELKDFLARENHLPGIPSANEVAEKGGVEVGELQRRMLETIEQQALYILQLEERLTRLETAIGNERMDQR